MFPMIRIVKFNNDYKIPYDNQWFRKIGFCYILEQFAAKAYK